MRLLQVKDGDVFSLVERVGNNIPPYAILSHTWGADEDEVTFRDLVDSTGGTKAGYSKIRFCAQQATKDNLYYIWVDTCCIDKSSSAELSEAINSMFRWYYDAAKCYAYLPDVSTSGFTKIDQSFQRSRWFTRGWTLQELVAPRLVEFFSVEGERLGDRASLLQEIHAITGISIQALGGSPLSQFTVNERLSWAHRRQTKREEDAAYCLLGLFDIHLPLLYGEGQKKAFIRLQKEIEESSKGQSFTITPKFGGWYVPFTQNERFVGRQTQLDQLEHALFTKHQPSKVALTGLGGIGKTQIALALAYQTRENHPQCSVFWIPATNAESLQQAFEVIGQQLGVPGIEEEQADAKRLVQNYLSRDSAGQWLLIVDNVDDLKIWNSELKDSLPKAQQGRVLCTTRSRKVAVKIAGATVIEVPGMDKEVAMQLLSKSLINQDLLCHHQDVLELLEQLTFLPLAIAQAAAYINENGLRLLDYLLLLKEQEQDVIDLLSEDFEDEGRYQDLRNPVATTWLISFEHIQQLDPLAAEYLSFMSCVALKGIPQSLLPRGSSLKKETDAIGTLTAYSFVSRRALDNSLDVHRLVHLVTRSWLRAQDQWYGWANKTLERLLEVVPFGDYDKREIWMAYLPHAIHVVDLPELCEAKGRLRLLSRIGSCEHMLGRYKAAEWTYQQLLKQREKMLGKEHPHTLASMGNLAQALSEQGKYTEAEKINRETLALREKVLGKEHPHTLAGMHNLALSLHNQGKYVEAENINRETLALREKILGKEHPDTLASMGNLAQALSEQGKYTEAEKMNRETLALREQVLGKEHPHTLVGMHSLALSLHNQGKHAEAEKMNRETLALREKVLGKEHPDTLTSMGNLAQALSEQGKHTEAEKMIQETLALREKVLGMEHPHTLAGMDNLAVLLSEQGKHAEAEKMNRKTLALWEKVLGKKHLDTLTSMGNLAQALNEQGKYTEAEKINRETLALREQVLGKEHPHTLAGMHSLALSLHNQGKYAEAEKMNRETLEIREKVLGK
jgi:tetratricopeptide (TPR) repeat protein